MLKKTLSKPFSFNGMRFAGGWLKVRNSMEELTNIYNNQHNHSLYELYQILDQGN